MKTIISKVTLLFASFLLMAGVFAHPVGAQSIISTPPIVGGTSCVSLTYNMGFGSRDAYTQGQVSQLQQYLNQAGYMSYPPSGFYGTLTFTGVRRFQSANGIISIGLVGPVTRAKIQSLSCGGNPVPPTQSLSISSMSPTSGQIGTTVTLSGYGFTSNDVVKFGAGAINNVTFINTNTLRFTIPSYMGQYCPVGSACTALAMQVQNGVYPVSVTDGYATSNALNFTVGYGQTNGTPTISSISPSYGSSGSLVTVYGSGFDSNSSVYFSGAISVTVPATVQNSNQLTFVVPSSTNYQCFVAPCNQQSITSGNYQVAVHNNYGQSNAVNFTVGNGQNNGTPTITSITPNPTVNGSAETIYGSNFSSDSKVMYNYGNSSTLYSLPATFINSSQITFNLPFMTNCNNGCTNGSVTYTYYILVQNIYGSSNTVQVTVGSGSNIGNLSISGIDAPTSLAVYNSGTWTVHVNNSNSGYLHYSVVWGDEGYYGNTTSAAPQSIYSNTASFTHTYQYRGTFTPKFTVTDDYGHTVSSTATVTVY